MIWNENSKYKWNINESIIQWDFVMMKFEIHILFQ